MVGHYLYTAPVPVPEAPASAMLLAGFALLLPLAGIARRRGPALRAAKPGHAR